MSPPEAGFVAVVLAGQRQGRVDPLAMEAGVPNKALVPILGEALIRHVVLALAATPGLVRLRIVVEPQTAPLIEAALPPLRVPVDYLPAAGNLADSVRAAAEGVDGPLVVTTADNVLLTPVAASTVLAAVAGGAEAVMAVAREFSVRSAHPDGQRRFYRLADDAYSNCNLYALAGPRALAAAESFRSGGQFAKKPLRLVTAVGLVDLVLLLTHRLSLRGVMARMSRRFRLRLEAVVLADGAHAIDVDNPRTHAVAEALLAARVAAVMRAAS